MRAALQFSRPTRKRRMVRKVDVPVPHIVLKTGLAVGLTGSTIGSLLVVQKRLAKSTYHSSLSEYCSIEGEH